MSEARFNQIDERLLKLEENDQQIQSLLKKLSEDVESLKTETTKTNDKVEIYQKASQQVVNLAFGLILAATAAIVIPTVLGR